MAILAVLGGLVAGALVAIVINALFGDCITRLLRALVKAIPWPWRQPPTIPADEANRLHRQREDVERALLREKEDLKTKLERLDEALRKVQAPLGPGATDRKG